MRGPAGPDSAFLVERELFAQEEILGCERALRSETEDHKAEQIPKQVQPKQAEFYHAPRSLVFALLPSKCLQFSSFQVTPIICADDNRIICTNRLARRSFRRASRCRTLPILARDRRPASVPGL